MRPYWEHGDVGNVWTNHRCPVCAQKIAVGPSGMIAWHFASGSSLDWDKECPASNTSYGFQLRKVQDRNTYVKLPTWEMYKGGVVD